MAGIVTANKSANWVTAYVVTISLGLTMVGLVMLFSAGAVRGAQDLLIKQIVWVVASLLVGGYASIVNLEWLRNRTVLIFGLCILGLVLTLIPGIGVKVNGAQRWIGLGALRIQPSEFAKIGMVLLLAKYFSDQQRLISSLVKGFLLPSIFIGCVCGLILLQPDFGTCFLCGTVGAILMFQAGVSLRWLLPVAGLAVSVFSVLVYFDPVRIRRVTPFLMWKQMRTTVLINSGRACLHLVWEVWKVSVLVWEGNKCIFCPKPTPILFFQLSGRNWVSLLPWLF